jgi:hypothetical protein
MAQKRKYRFTVQGSGSFPFDMLRYDSCYPFSSSDACNIPEPHRYGPQMGRSPGNHRKVTLVSENEPTPGRWESFGWACGMVDRL